MTDTRTCSVCTETFPETEQFYYRFKNRKQPWYAHCKTCHNERMRTYHREDRDINRAANLRRNFGMTVAEYDAMHDLQGGVCAVCGEPETIGQTTSKGVTTRWLAVDHCHESGQIRGLLCGACNTGIGKLKDSPALLMAAVAYLGRSVVP